MHKLKYGNPGLDFLNRAFGRYISYISFNFEVQISLACISPDVETLLGIWDDDTDETSA